MATLVIESMASTPSTGSATGSGGYGWNAGGWYVFSANQGQWGSLGYSGAISCPFTASFDAQMTATNGADGSWFYFGCNAVPQEEGTSTNIGYLISRGNFGNDIEIRYGGSVLDSVAYTKDTNFDSLSIAVSVSGSNYSFVISYLGSIVLTYSDPTARTLPGTLYGWGARCGYPGVTMNNNVKNLLLTDSSGGATGPANLKSYNTNLKANIKSINTNLIANVKSLDTNV